LKRGKQCRGKTARQWAKFERRQRWTRYGNSDNQESSLCVSFCSGLPPAPNYQGVFQGRVGGDLGRPVPKEGSVPLCLFPEGKGRWNDGRRSGGFRGLKGSVLMGERGKANRHRAGVASVTPVAQFSFLEIRNKKPRFHVRPILEF
jgi:hypothetical protein